MPNLKEVRARIASVSSTKQITSAMKMVSAAKLRRAQDAIIQMRPYAEKLQEILENLSSSVETSGGGAYFSDRPVKNILIVAVTSNRGLCGAFNANVIKGANRLIAENKDAEVTVLPVGKKAYDYFKKTKYNIKGTSLPHNLNHIYENLKFEVAADVAEKIMAEFANKQFDRVYLIYNRFKNAAVQVLTTEQFLPVMPPAADKDKKSSKTNLDYIFEPEKEQIVLQLIPKSLKTQFYKAVLDSHAAEHGARMTAMHKATDNASELLKSLKLSYNKARQAAITNEILEIVAGAEALNG
jgi:F-type H+-transporting ATPase subunit gamma